MFVLHNTADREILIRVERTATRSDALTAAKAASVALFRELFPGEILAPGQLATVSTVTLLFASLDPARADALYHDLGDARAFGMIHEHLEHLGTAIRKGGGAVIKTMGEAVLASFSQVTAAVETALSLEASLDTRRRIVSAFEVADRSSSRAGAGGHAQRPARLFRSDSARRGQHRQSCRQWWPCALAGGCRRSRGCRPL